MVFENTRDPITLEMISSIPKEKKFIWMQKGKKYCVDIESIYHYVNSGKTILPWAIDTATGIAEAKDRDAYLKKYDMSSVRGLLNRINKAYSELESKTLDVSQVTIPERVKHRFTIEDICPDMYISHIIDFFEQNNFDLIFNMMCYALRKTFAEYKELSEYDDQHDSYVIEAIEQCFHGLYNRDVIKTPNLELVSSILYDWSQVLNSTVMVKLFDIFSEIIQEFTL
jgi:hypothetical protein